MKWSAECRPYARFTGCIYLLYFVTAVSGELLLTGIVTHGDAPATAAKLVQYQTRFQAGLAVGLLSTVFYIALTGLFYRLFAPVNRNVSLIAAMFSLVGCGVLASASLFRMSSLKILTDGPSLRAFSTEQSNALALLSLEMYGHCVEICFVFFGVYCGLIGYLILGSTFLPRILGLWMVLTGSGWLLFLFPPLAHSLRVYIVANGFLCEVILMLWLLVMGIDDSRWQRQMNQARA
jgi:Domain of unknown function (DUF4386)